MTSPAAPANTSASAQQPAATPTDNKAATQSAQSLLQDVCVVEGKEVSAPILIERPIAETKVVEIQPGQEYLFGFGKNDPVSYIQDGDDLTISFDCGGVLVLKGYGPATQGSGIAQFAFSDIVPQGVLAGLIKTAEAKDEKILEDEMIAKSKAHNKQADGQNVANIEPAAGDQDAQKLAAIEPAAGEEGGGGQNTGFGFGSSFSSEPVGPLQAVGPIDPTALQYNAEFPTPRPFIETPEDFNPDLGIAANAVDETNMIGGMISVNGNIPVDFGADGPGTIAGDGAFFPGGSLPVGGLMSHGVAVSVNYDIASGTYTGTAGATTVFTMAIDPATGNYVFTLLAPIDHADAANPNDVISLVFGVIATDDDGDTASTSVTISVFDDAPHAVAAMVENIDEADLSGGPIVVNDNLAINFGNDGPGAVHVSGTSNASGDLPPGGLSSGGNAVTISFDTATNTYTGTSAIGTVFTMVINPATGAYTFTLFKPVDHSAPGDTITLNFGVNVEDYDHDSTPTNITINIVDDVPHISDTPGIGSGIETVDETNLGPITVGGALDVDFGNDGAGAVTLVGGYTSSVPLTSHGAVVDVVKTGNVYEGKVGVDVIFRLELQPNGQYSFTQFGVLDHPDATNPNDSITLNFSVQVSDSDGDTDTGSITINVLDDGPVAVNDTLSSSDDSAPITGNVLTNDDAGEDDLGAVKSIEFGGVVTNIAPGATVNIVGAHGTLQISSNGAFTYTPVIGSDGQDDFKYTMHDYDNDPSSAILSIAVNDDEPILVQPEIVTVDETNLTPTTSISDTIQANFFSDAPGSFAGNGGFTGGPFTSGGDPVNVAFNAIANTYTGTAGGATIFTLTIQPNGAYTFTLNGVLDHPVDGPTPADHNDQVSMQFGITATDSDGDTASGTITVNVLDDGLKANDDFNLFDHDLGPATGNVISGLNGGPGAADDLSEDTDNTVTQISFGGTTVNVPTVGQATIDGDFGQLKISADGSYTYTPFDMGGGGGGAGTTHTLNPLEADTVGIQNTFTKDGITIKSWNGNDLTWVSNADGFGVGIANTAPSASPKIFPYGEIMEVDFADAAETVTVKIGDIGANNLAGGIDFKVYIEGSAIPVNYEFNIGTTTPVNGIVTITLNSADFGGHITGFDLFSIANSALSPTSMILNNVSTTVPGGDDCCGTDQFIYTLTDGDGDISKAKLTLECQPDDAPILVQPEIVTVDETNMAPTTSISDSIQADFGIDAPGSFSGNGGFTGGPFTSHGVAVTVAFDAITNTYTGSASGATVFTLVIQPNGNYTFTLVKPLDHPVDGPTPADHNDQVSMQFGITATDDDGDTADGTITVNVLDDGPLAVNDSFNAANDATPVVGNVLANDNPGKDGLGAVQSVEFGGVTTNIAPGATVNVVGDFGTLQISSNGAFTYTPNAGSDGQDDFKYTMNDYDGDISKAKLSICVADDEPILIQPEIVTVDETNMSPTTSISDSIQANFFSDAPGTFAGNGGFTGGPFTSHGVAVNVTFDAATRTYTGAAAGTPVFTLVVQTNGAYTFTLLKPLDHPVDGPTPADHNDSMSMQFGVTATDSDGDSVTGTITVNVLDDGPKAYNDFNTVPHSTNTADGNVITGLNGGPGAADTLSKDVDNTVTKIAFGGTSVNVPTVGQATIDGAFGQLKISADGTYTYTQFAATPGAGGLKHFTAGPVAFPDMNESQALDGTEVQAKGIAAGNLDISEGDQISVKFVSEGAGYSNTFGAFTILADGTLHLTQILIANGNNVAPGPSFNMTAGAGDTEFGLFIIADGYSVNGGYAGINFNVGHLDFVFDYGLATERAAKATDDGSHIKLVYTSPGGVETVLNGPLYYTTERGGVENLNADDSVRVVSAIAPGGDDTVLRIGFEDLPGLGDNDFNDIVIDLSVREAAEDCGTDVFTYTLTDGDGDTSPATLTLQCEPCDIDVELKVNNGADKICVKEDGQGVVPLNAHYTGGDGDEVLTLKVTGVTTGWTVTSPGWVNNGGGVYTLTLPAGQALYTGNMTFKPPANSDVDLKNLVFTATVSDPDTGGTETDTDLFTVQVDAVVDTPVLNVPANFSQGIYYAPSNVTIPLNISSNVTDTDGSEMITKIVVRLNSPFNVPLGPYNSLADMGITLNKGTQVSPGVWEIPVNAGNTTTALSGLKMVVPNGANYYDIHQSMTGQHQANIIVESHVKEKVAPGDGNGECDFTDNNTVVIKAICMTFFITPLVVDLDGNGVQLLMQDAGVMFDMNNNGTLDHTSWVSASDGLLSIDLNHDGMINNQSELFGNSATAMDGFANLAQYDANADGVINASDDVFSQLTIWQDVNSDGISQAGEMRTLSDIGITEISLNAVETGEVAGDSIISHESTVTYADGHQAEIVDAWFNVMDGASDTAVTVINGTEGNDVIIGNDGIDVISGGAGTDTLFGGAGSDIFLFQGLDGSVDTIADFNASEGDALDISALLNGFDAVQDSINDFVFQTEIDGNTVISVDANGSGNVANATTVAVLQGVTGLSIEDITHHQQTNV